MEPLTEKIMALLDEGAKQLRSDPLAFSMWVAEVSLKVFQRGQKAREMVNKEEEHGH